ncbi:unnamed protein product [Dracunculus medinensis]|uniref:guanylate cyclase n=1 Tax=Dracunculus medinensis TaxID=318479 RepID=A0A3P7Q8L7_DRAME|nr:unnamed protein product [Dracunculus medinensis]
MTENQTNKRRAVETYALLGASKGEFICLKQCKRISWSKERAKMLCELKSLNHENLTNFLGICHNETDRFYTIYTLVERASLEDFIFDQDFNMDATFKSAFIKDIIKGLLYLHKSPIGYHGMLSLKTCLIDSNWVLKMTCFGISTLFYELIKDEYLKTMEIISHKYYINIAPELLEGVQIGRMYPPGTPSGDIYSFGMALFSIIYRCEPFEKTRLAMKGNLVDQMIKMNEKYAQNLERIVAERTSLLIEAQEQTDRLLCEMLPPTIAAQLKSGLPVIPRNYDSVTVAFCQIVDFSLLMAKCTPDQVISFLNDVFTRFDIIINRHDAYKVETTGETYMVASGVPNENQGRHIFEVAEIALEIRQVYFYFTMHTEWNLRVRIGFHCGPIAAGVIGLRSPRYCLFGDTVNFASRMQSNCQPNQIQMAETTAKILMNSTKYQLTKRGIVHVKGKGFTQLVITICETQDIN